MAFIRLFKCNRNLFFLSSLSHKIVWNTFTRKTYWKIIYKMNTVYFHNGENGKFSVYFLFSNKKLKIEKAIQMERNITECIGDFLVRLDNKLNKLFVLVEKKRKKALDFNEFEAINSLCLLDDKPAEKDVVFQDIFDNKICGSWKLRILDDDYNIIINPPIINQFQLPKAIRVGCAVFLEKFESVGLDQDLSEFKWFKSNKKSEWMECGEGYFYTPTKEDCNCFLKLVCVPKNKMHTGPICNAVSDTRVEEFDGICQIQKRHEYTQNKTNDDEFRVVSYNTLAGVYSKSKESKNFIFEYCDPNVLDINYRKDLLSIELKGYNADLICLQEVDKKIFLNNLEPVFRSIGYMGSFCEKSNIREGCALFYDKEKFNVLYDKSHVLTQELLENPLLEEFKVKIIHNEKLMNKLISLHSLIQVLVLECLTQKNHLIVVGNTHFYFHPDSSHIKLLQGIISMKILLEKMNEMEKLHPNNKISMLLCGDFNMTPECGFHLFLNEGSINSDHSEWKTKNDEDIKDISCTHSLNLKSACDTSQYTNYTKSFKACLDYIYFQTNHLEVKQTVPFPSEEDLSQYIGIPSKFFPSDHLALVVDFKFKSS